MVMDVPRSIIIWGEKKKKAACENQNTHFTKKVRTFWLILTALMVCVSGEGGRLGF